MRGISIDESNGEIVAVGDDGSANGRLVTSNDAITWSLDATVYTTLLDVTGNNGIWVATGADTYYSTDRVTWTQNTSVNYQNYG